MKLAIICDEVSMDLNEVAQWMKELDVDAVELRGVWDQNITSADDEVMAKTRKAIKDHGLKVCGIASPFFKCPLEGSDKAEVNMHGAPIIELDKQMDTLKRSIALANEFGAPFIRIFSFLRTLPASDEVVQKIANMLEEPLKEAEKAGVTLLMENEHACILGRADETAKLFKYINSPYLKAVYDPGNSYQLDENPYPDGFDTLKPYTVHYHLKDSIKTDNGYKWVIVGEGKIDFHGMIQQLKRENYSGYLSLETHAKVEGLSSAEISRRCIQNIRRMMES